MNSFLWYALTCYVGFPVFLYVVERRAKELSHLEKFGKINHWTMSDFDIFCETASGIPPLQTGTLWILAPLFLVVSQVWLIPYLAGCLLRGRNPFRRKK